jgi:hypothetical protein
MKYSRAKTSYLVLQPMILISLCRNLALLCITKHQEKQYLTIWMHLRENVIILLQVNMKLLTLEGKGRGRLEVE